MSSVVKAQRSQVIVRGLGQFGIAASIAFALTLGLLTAHQTAFLQAVGWSPTGRSPVQWPSLMAVGPNGWVLIVCLLVTGTTAVLVAAAHAATAGPRMATIATVVFALGLLLVAFKTDPPWVTSASWHAQIHNGAYFLIPIGALAAMGAEALRSHQPTVRKGCRVLLPATFGAFVLTGIDPIAQLARYFAFAGVLAWFVLACWSLARWRAPSSPATKDGA